MTEITREEMLELVSFKKVDGKWVVMDVKVDVWRDVMGDVVGSVYGDVERDVRGSVWGDVKRNVYGDVECDVYGSVGVDVYGDVGGSVLGKVKNYGVIPSTTDKLMQARRQRDEAQARYQAALEEHRAEYPWLVIEEREEQPAEDMTDPANWQEGDWLECKRSGKDLTAGKLYQVLGKDSCNDPVIDDDADLGIARAGFHFRFHSRPQ